MHGLLCTRSLLAPSRSSVSTRHSSHYGLLVHECYEFVLVALVQETRFGVSLEHFIVCGCALRVPVACFVWLCVSDGT